jgi:hypothetical protein
VAAVVSFVALGGVSLTVARSFFLGDTVTGDSVAVVADVG